MSSVPFTLISSVTTSTCYNVSLVAFKKKERSFIIEGNRSSAWAVSLVCAKRERCGGEEEALREMRNRSCACGRTVSLSPLFLLPPLFHSFFLSPWTASTSLRPCLSFGPVCLPTRDQTQIQFSRPRSLETTIYSFKQTLLSLSLSLSFSLAFSFRRSFFHSLASRLPVEHTDAALVREERISRFPNCPPLSYNAPRGL